MTAITFIQPSFIQQLEAKAYDLRFRARGERRGASEVIVVALDEKSIEKLGRWPWPRIYWAKFMRNLASYKPKVIALDVIFSEPDQNINLNFIKSIRKTYELKKPAQLDEKISALLELTQKELSSQKQKQKKLTSLLKKSQSQRQKNYLKKQLQQVQKKIKWLNELEERIKTLSSRSNDEFLAYLSQLEEQLNADQIFAQTLNEIDNEILGWFFFQTKTEARQVGEEENLRRFELIKPFSIKLIKYISGANPFLLARAVPDIYGFQVNLPIFSDKISGSGFFTFISDPDGVFRKAPLIAGWPPAEKIKPDDELYLFPSLSLEALRIYLNAQPMVVAIKSNPSWAMVDKIKLGNINIPVDERGRIIINYQGGLREFTTYSFYDVYNDFAEQRKKGFNPVKAFKNKIVLVGATAVGIYDIRATPLGTMPGVYLHANIIDNVLHQRVLIAPGWMRGFDIIVVLFLGIILSLLYPRIRPIFSAGLVLVLILGYAYFNFYMFNEKHLSLSLTYPLLTVFFIYLGITLYHYTMEEREKRFIRSAFSYYLSDEVINQLLAHPEKLKLGGERKFITIMFSDLQGFTSLSERMEPEELVSLLNHYLTEMSEIILTNRGTIDKFEGDAIMAFFGAPLDYPDHAQSACFSALQMQKKLKELNQIWREKGLPELRARIGINTGYALVGNMGSEKRMDYTAIGDEVNLASRLEGANKIYQSWILISESTYQQAKDYIEARELDLIRVVGKEKPVKVYELLAKKGELDEKMQRLIKLFAEGLKLYRKRKFTEAKSIFQKCLEINANDYPSQLYLERCQMYIENPPSADWDGVFQLKTK